MALTLPWIVILAALFYLVASKAGWLEALARRSQQRGQGNRRRGPGAPAGPDEERAVRRRLQVFEEFLSGLGRDDSDKDA